MKEKQIKAAVFLDRDGTINKDSGYISRPDDFNIYPFAGEAVKLLNDAGFHTIMVTNQSGIARGLYTFENLDIIHAKMKDQLAQSGAYIDKIYLSPYSEEGHIEPYNIRHNDRKPELGMFYKAKQNFDFEVKNSFMVGDRYADIEFGKRAGLTTILVLTGDGEKELYEKSADWKYKPDYIVENLLAAAKLILKKQ